MIDGQVVVVRHRAGDATYHLLPGGGVTYRETLADAVVREAREETGLEVRVGSPLLINDTVDPVGSRHLVNITFAAEVIGGSLTDDPDDKRVEAVELVDPDALTTLDLRPPFAEEIIRMIEAGPAARAEYLGSLFTPDTRPHVT